MVPDKIFRAGGGLFAAEKLLPHLLPDDQVADPQHKSIDWEVASYKDLLSQPRFAEGLRLSLIKYADLVARNLSGLEPEVMAAVDVAVSQRMKTGDPLRLTKEIIDYKPISGGGIEPRLLDDLAAVRNEVIRPH